MTRQELVAALRQLAGDFERLNDPVIYEWQPPDWWGYPISPASQHVIASLPPDLLDAEVEKFADTGPKVIDRLIEIAAFLTEAANCIDKGEGENE